MGGLAAIALGTGGTRAPLVLLGVAAICRLSIAAALPVPQALVWPVAAVAGAAIGLDSPPDVVSIQLAYVIMLGTWIGAVIVLGSWIAASAILVLALRLAR